jgi:peptide-methionine (R)-S-oxide reductase
MSDYKDVSKEVYHVCWEGGTEPPFSGKYYNHDEVGSYHCACCERALFRSDSKFPSSSGWPSFFQSVEKAVSTCRDTSHGMVREEIKCANCGAHLGHVFEDGPEPTGLRYCVNSLALSFVQKA